MKISTAALVAAVSIAGLVAPSHAWEPRPLDQRTTTTAKKPRLPAGRMTYEHFLDLKKAGKVPEVVKKEDIGTDSFFESTKMPASFWAGWEAAQDKK